MEQRRLKKVLQIGGMTCTGCEMRIENKLKKEIQEKLKVFEQQLDGILDENKDLQN